MAKGNSYAGQTCLPMKSDKVTSEYGTGTDAGRSRVTEGRQPPLKTPHGTGSEDGPRGRKSAKVKHL